MWAEVSSDTCCHAQKWGSWEAGKREPHRLRGKGGCGLGWTWGAHGNLAFLFLTDEVPQQLLWVLEPPVRVWGGGGGGTDGTVPGAGGGEAGAGIPHLVSCALLILALLCSLQIMIEFCPGGAVDAIMLGESALVQGVGGWLCLGQASFTPTPVIPRTCEHRPLCPLLGPGVRVLERSRTLVGRPTHSAHSPP